MVTFPATEKLAAPVQVITLFAVNAVQPEIPPVEAVSVPVALRVKVEVMVTVFAPQIRVPAPENVTAAQALAASTVIECAPIETLSPATGALFSFHVVLPVADQLPLALEVKAAIISPRRMRLRLP